MKRGRIGILAAAVGVWLAAAMVGAGDEGPGGAGVPPVQRHLFLLRGADGEESLRGRFEGMMERWREAAVAAGDVVVREIASREAFEAELGSLVTEEELWIVMIGHGTWDGRVAKFNFEGEDLSAEEMGVLLEGRTHPLVIINTASASGPFLPALSGPGRVVVTATKSGEEVNLTRFGVFLGQVLQDETADLNKDGQNSILECFLLAAKRTEAFYEEEGRIATEHALLEDTGDGKGIRPEWFEGLRLVRKPEGEEEPDGALARSLHFVPGATDRLLGAEQRRRRDELEREVEQLVERREAMDEGAYYEALERVFLEIAEIYGAAGDS